MILPEIKSALAGLVLLATAASPALPQAAHYLSRELFVDDRPTRVSEKKRTTSCHGDVRMESYPREQGVAVVCKNTIDQYECQSRDQFGVVNQKKFHARMDQFISVMHQTQTQLSSIFPDTAAYLAFCKREMKNIFP
ncbi:hypothetical protein FV228_00170 [Methylobacterium sp. WL18]|uniref:hypothetical protein n=1 Tax=Methylobacterium sp. WL18 TaxID=2603897 RepID=UPI0011CB6FC9|nr:hypothetical protein [Methylobacterium sp. WL18]TXN76604.1 hypothetical protein FV228_00170 [Methylobacterium sp. WL18]